VDRQCDANTYIILSALGGSGLMFLSAIGTQWLGWRRVSVPNRGGESHCDESDINRQTRPYAGSQPAGEHADGATE
jgi:hypothetical protein